MTNLFLIAALFISLSVGSIAEQTLFEAREPVATLVNEESCAAILSKPPYAKLYGEELLKLRIRDLGKALVGRSCPIDVLNSYFLARGWKLGDEGTITPGKTTAPAARANYYKSFCLPRSIFLRWLDRCQASAVFYFEDGVLVHIASGISK